MNTVKELRNLAKDKNIKGYYKMKKDDLINVLKNDSSTYLNDIFPFEDSFYEPESEKPQNIIELIEIKEIESKFVKKYKAYSSNYTISIKNSELIEDPSKDEQTDLITRALEEMIKEIKKRTNFKRTDKINIIVRNPGVIRYPISTGYIRGNSSRELVQFLLERISQIWTSNEELDLTTSTFNINVIAMPQGGHNTKILNLAQAKQTKTSITQIKNKDNLCCPRAVVVALTYPTENPSITIIFKKEFSKL